MYPAELVPFWPGGLAALRALNAALADLAARHGAAVADVHARFLGHGVTAGDPSQLLPMPASRDLWYCSTIEPTPGAPTRSGGPGGTPCIPPADGVAFHRRAPGFLIQCGDGFVQAVVPRRAFGIHERQLNERGLEALNGWLGYAAGTDYRYLAPGETA
jgi:hypothetical protein